MSVMVELYTSIWREIRKTALKYEYEKAYVYKHNKNNITYTEYFNTNIRVYYYTPFTIFIKCSTVPLFINQIHDGIMDGIKIDNSIASQLLRRSNLYLSWNSDNIYNFDPENLYTPSITIYKDAEGNTLPVTYKIACYNIKLPKNPNVYIENGNTKYVSEMELDKTREIIELCFILAVEKNHKILIFGDLNIHSGHPAYDMAKLIKEYSIKYPIQTVLLAMGDGNLNKKDDTYEEFYNTLH